MTTPKTATPEPPDSALISELLDAASAYANNSQSTCALWRMRDANKALRDRFSALRAAPAQCDVQSKSVVPPAKPSDAEGGWRVDVDWLSDMQTEVEKATGYGVTLECVEEIVLRVAALALPSAEGK